MKIGVPKEVKTEEYRVAVTPSGVKELVKNGHTVYVQTSAGEGSGFSDDDYAAAGAELLEGAAAVFDAAELIVKVKEPIAQEYPLFKEGQTLFTYLHLAADEAQTKFLLEKKIKAYAYETLKVDRRLPLLEPMSEVAGKMAAIMGGFYLGRYQGGRGILPGGVVGTPRADVMILGGGVAGLSAAQVAAGMGAKVTILDINLARLHYLNDVLPANVSTLYSTTDAIESLLPKTDIVIGTVLIPGAKAPKLITKEMLSIMQEGSVLIDVSIDQGGCFETSRATTHTEPTYVVDGVVHYCVANMPGAYPRTSTMALTNATLPYLLKLAEFGGEEAYVKFPLLHSALNTYDGKLTNLAVAEAHGLEYCEL
ncbi:alanine dehydrogenase [Sulfurimonas sp. HSL1-2]|uniref:alanine dehydrogenase n=1 Tax=Thiomicrolovo zhangzhouensis TaxID=3131933 RepID=UPI0031F7BDB8